MENASKALLIAAAILIAIILISLGLVVINQGREAIDEAGSGVSEVAVSQFNSKFESYLGSSKSGSTVRTLLNEINANNRQNVDDSSKQILVYYRSDSNATEKLWSPLDSNEVVGQITAAYISSIERGSSYTVEVTNTNGYTTAGYIHSIKITKK